jgi:methyl-accepting chemotaxis protein
MNDRKSKSVARKLSVIIAIMIFISTVSVGAFGYIFYRMDTVRLGGERALAIAISVAAAPNAETFETAMQTGKKDAMWAYVKSVADRSAVNNGVQYLYILGAEYDDAFTYYAEGYNPITEEEELGFGYREDAEIYDDQMFGTIESGEPSTSGIYESGDFGLMVSGFAPIINADGKVVGVVGVDLTVGDVLSDAHAFGVKTLLIVIGFSLLFGIISIIFIKRRVGVPINRLTVAAESISTGDMDIQLDIDSDDEIGRLSRSFHNMVLSTQNQIALLEQLSNGDLTVNIEPRCDKDQMSFAIMRMVENLNTMFRAFNDSSDHLATTSEHIAGGADSLASGAVEQHSTIEGLAASIGMITEKTKENAAMSEKATRLVDSIKSNAQKGAAQMQQMLEAVREINEASASISKVMKTIDDIAFQTNILALNAAVEAARAGQHGKGFAVVAGEVGNLASKSAESAKETSDLIANSLKKTVLGVKLAQDTALTFEDIVNGINESGKIVEGISLASSEQNREIAEINRNLQDVAAVVQRTSDTAGDSAEASKKLSIQADQLKAMLARFKLAEQDISLIAYDGVEAPGDARYRLTATQ